MSRILLPLTLPILFLATAPFPAAADGADQQGRGGSRTRFEMIGRLYFGVNDDHLLDNSGEFTVTVRVQSTTTNSRNQLQ